MGLAIKIKMLLAAREMTLQDLAGKPQKAPLVRGGLCRRQISGERRNVLSF